MQVHDASVIVLGVIPANGRLGVGALVPELGAGIEGIEIVLQSVSTTGSRVLPGMPGTLVLLHEGL